MPLAASMYAPSVTSPSIPFFARALGSTTVLTRHVRRGATTLELIPAPRQYPNHWCSADGNWCLHWVVTGNLLEATMEGVLGMRNGPWAAPWHLSTAFIKGWIGLRPVVEI